MESIAWRCTNKHPTGNKLLAATIEMSERYRENVYRTEFQVYAGGRNAPALSGEMCQRKMRWRSILSPFTVRILCGVELCSFDVVVRAVETEWTPLVGAREATCSMQPASERAVDREVEQAWPRVAEKVKCHAGTDQRRGRS